MKRLDSQRLVSSRRIRTDSFLLVDDLEHGRSEIANAVFLRYREALDSVLKDSRWRAGVHFLVNMLEAYYFADPVAVKTALGIEIDRREEDVESIRHPKRELKVLIPGFDEVKSGNLIARQISLERVLEYPERCASLRSLVAWCTRALGRPVDDRFQLKGGAQFAVTAGQKEQLPPVG